MTSEAARENREDLTFCILASGSKGNAIYISDSSTAVLIDAGLSGKEIERRLETRGLSPENLDAILVSHEHSDHIQSVGVLSRRFSLPVYMNTKTLETASNNLGKMHDIKQFSCGSSFKINRLTIHPFSVSHDAEDPAGFTVNKNGVKIGIATDLGIVTSLVKEHLKGCSLVVLEANHDLKMLEDGPYVWTLKQRVKGRTGHLSNEDTRKLLKEINHSRLKHVILAHLSEENNTPEIAVNTVGEAINPGITKLSVASQNRCGKLLRLS